MKPTLSFAKPIPIVQRRHLLPADVSVVDVADACRSAALGFVWGAEKAFGKRELACWLVGPYAAAVSSTSGLGAPRRPATRRAVDAATIRDLLARTHARVMELLERSSTWAEDPPFAAQMVDGGLVVDVADEHGDLGYAPIDSSDMRLFDRVVSLFVADYLTRPGDYDALRVCRVCRGATFELESAHERCGTTRRDSGVVARRAQTLVGLAAAVR